MCRCSASVAWKGLHGSHLNTVGLGAALKAGMLPTTATRNHLRKGDRWTVWVCSFHGLVKPYATAVCGASCPSGSTASLTPGCTAAALSRVAADSCSASLAQTRLHICCCLHVLLPSGVAWLVAARPLSLPVSSSPPTLTPPHGLSAGCPRCRPSRHQRAAAPAGASWTEAGSHPDNERAGSWQQQAAEEGDSWRGIEVA